MPVAAVVSFLFERIYGVDVTKSLRSMGFDNQSYYSAAARVQMIVAYTQYDKLLNGEYAVCDTNLTREMRASCCVTARYC